MSLKLDTNHLMGVAAVLFAGFALWQFTKKPGGQVASQPGQRQQNAALQVWNDMLGANWASTAYSSQAYSQVPLSSLTFGSAPGA
ncbi:hypothetical protein [Roseateles sp.]|uniref:hypothetical protein n=1 Tax=Roseateles sp. TaxID=1971397 RepID=UPI002E065D0C|nr:hypothetical protein [Roseateles sp.]